VKHLHRSLIIGCSLVALSACGPEEIASPGSGGNITINQPTPTPTPAPTPTPTSTPNFTAATSCPTIADPQGLENGGTLNVPGGTVLVCSLPARFNVSSTLPSTPDTAAVVYEMTGRVDVGTDGGPSADASDGLDDTNVVLTIESGVTVYGGVGNSHLVVNRGNQINAVGTPSAPIVFTSRQNVLGNTTDSNDSQWGGVILLGRAPISDCADGGATGGTVGCENQVEGTPLPALYGGATDNDDSGTMSYVQLRYSGFAFDQDNELQSLTTGGTGYETSLDHIQSFNSSDDGVEVFGGYANIKHFVAVGAGDDLIDTDFGAQINMQWVIAVQRTATGNGVIEADSGGRGDSLPRQDTRIANATFIARSTVADAAALRFRGGTDFALANVVMDATGLTGRQCLDLDDAETTQATGPDENGAPFFASVFMACPAGNAFTDDGNVAETQAAFDATSNAAFTGATAKNSAFTSTLTMTFVNGTNEDGATAFDPTVFNRNGFTFDNPGYVGAANAADTWYQGWTCDSSTANFGSGSNCADSPFS